MVVDGEVVGVFGHVEVKHYETGDEAKKGYTSTVEANACGVIGKINHRHILSSSRKGDVFVDLGASDLHQGPGVDLAVEAR